MNLNYEKFDKIKKFKKNSKQKIIVLKGLIAKESENKIYKSVNKSLLLPTKIFKHNNKIVKYEYNDSNKFNYDLRQLYIELNSKKFLNILKKIFCIKNLYPDGNKLYSGLSVSMKNTSLKEHIDFNYNNKIKKYRVINLLLYLNKNYTDQNGGKFYYRNINSKKRKYIKPEFNNLVIFMTNKNMPHGFTKVSKKRISLNIYYYSKNNLTLTKSKHKTKWL
tara:strand:- start:841 stop:1500 length:660 start_codon:yes stop_codon:yes gene_type:complete